MKTMTCKQLGGACDQKFQANTFDDIAQLSKRHGMEMFQKKDEAHLVAMQKITDLMKQPNAMTEWFEEKKKQFDVLAED